MHKAGVDQSWDHILMVNEKRLIKQVAAGMKATSLHLKGRIIDEVKGTFEVLIGLLLNISVWQLWETMTLVPPLSLSFNLFCSFAFVSLILLKSPPVCDWVAILLYLGLTSS